MSRPEQKCLTMSTPIPAVPRYSCSCSARRRNHEIRGDFMICLCQTCPDSCCAADSALRQSSIAFCEQSLAWQTEHQPVFVMAGIGNNGRIKTLGHQYRD